MTRLTVIIPARYESSRFPGKPLAALRGSSGLAKTLIRRSWEAAANAVDPADIWVATDDDRVAREVENFGGQVVMTPGDCRNGTERCAAAIDHIPDCADIVVNLQGDAPLTPNYLAGKLAALIALDPAVDMATPAVRCSSSTYAHLLADRRAGRVGGTTLVFDKNGRALYFSKNILPFAAEDAPSAAGNTHLHLGVYAYRRDALRDYAAAPISIMEELEGLEQLRFLDRGRHVGVLPVEAPGWDCIELNNPTDIAAIEAVLVERGIE